VGFRGQATVEPFDHKRARRLLSRYLGEDERVWDERFKRTLDGCADQLLLRFVPETAIARDVSYAVLANTQPSAL